MKKLILASLIMLASGSIAFGQVPISGLPSATTPLAGTEVTACVQSGTTKKCTVSSIRTVIFATGSGSNSLTGPAEIFICTSTCSITPPVPVAGYQFCVLNDASISTVITIASPGGSVLFQKAVAPGTANGYGSAGGHMTSGRRG